MIATRNRTLQQWSRPRPQRAHGLSCITSGVLDRDLDGWRAGNCVFCHKGRESYIYSSSVYVPRIARTEFALLLACGFFFYSPDWASFEGAQGLACRSNARVGFQGMQAQKRRIDELVKVEIQIQAVVHWRLLVFQEHIVGHDWRFVLRGEVQAARQPVRLDGSRGRCCGLFVIGDLQWADGLVAGD
jgi:hypothetical protein